MKEDVDKLKSELQRREEELKNWNKKAHDLNQLQVQIGRLEVELSAKDNDVKRLEDNLGYLWHENSKLIEEVAAPLTRLLTAATEGNKVKKWWHSGSDRQRGSQK